MFHMGGLFPALRGTKDGQNVLLAPAISSVSLIHNNQYAKVAYFRVTYSAFFHVLPKKS